MNEEKKEEVKEVLDKHGNELIDPAKAAKLMEESYLEGIAHLRNASRELFETYAIKSELSEDFKSGMALVCKMIEEMSEQAVSAEFTSTIARDYLEKARKRALNSFRLPFFKSRRGKIKV